MRLNLKCNMLRYAWNLKSHTKSFSTMLYTYTRYLNILRYVFYKHIDHICVQCRSYKHPFRIHLIYNTHIIMHITHILACIYETYRDCFKKVTIIITKKQSTKQKAKNKNKKNIFITNMFFPFQLFFQIIRLFWSKLIQSA